MSRIISRELDVEEEVSKILGKFVNNRFNDVVIIDVERQYEVEYAGYKRKTDIAVLRER